MNNYRDLLGVRNTSWTIDRMLTSERNRKNLNFPMRRIKHPVVLVGFFGLALTLFCHIKEVDGGGLLAKQILLK